MDDSSNEPIPKRKDGDMRRFMSTMLVRLRSGCGEVECSASGSHQLDHEAPPSSGFSGRF